MCACARTQVSLSSIIENCVLCVPNVINMSNNNYQHSLNIHDNRVCDHLVHQFHDLSSKTIGEISYCDSCLEDGDAEMQEPQLRQDFIRAQLSGGGRNMFTSGFLLAKPLYSSFLPTVSTAHTTVCFLLSYFLCFLHRVLLPTD